MNDPLSSLHPHYSLRKQGDGEIGYAERHIVLFTECLNTARFGGSPPPGRNMPELQATLMGWADWQIELRLIREGISA